MCPAAPPSAVANCIRSAALTRSSEGDTETPPPHHLARRGPMRHRHWSPKRVPPMEPGQSARRCPLSRSRWLGPGSDRLLLVDRSGPARAGPADGDQLGARRRAAGRWWRRTRCASRRHRRRRTGRLCRPLRPVTMRTRVARGASRVASTTCLPVHHRLGRGVEIHGCSLGALTAASPGWDVHRPQPRDAAERSHGTPLPAVAYSPPRRSACCCPAVAEPGADPGRHRGQQAAARADPGELGARHRGQPGRPRTGCGAGSAAGQLRSPRPGSPARMVAW